MQQDENFKIVSSEYLTLEGRKISTSQNYAIWVKDLLDHYEADSIRYFLIANGPEKKDADFSWREYVHSHNSELLGAYGNFVNRTLAFIEKYCDGVVPQGNNNMELDNQHVASGYLLPEVEILFQRIDKKVIEEETEKLKAIL